VGELFYGTSSWSEKSWAGVFYPAGLAVSEQLSHYATQFRTVEADVTYYRVPDARLVGGWNTKTPANFVLSAKFPQSIVHGGKEATPDPERVLVHEHVAGDLERFLNSMSLLGDKCGPLVLQFPYFNQRVFKSEGPFLERLDAFLGRLPAKFRYGVEVRNKNWIAEPLLEILRRHRTALVLVDIAYMPHPADLAREHDLFTTDFTYARLIGDRKAIDALTERFDKVVVDQTPRLAKWAELLRAATNRLPRIFAYANNHYAGYAPDTIRDLAARV
jgi:uncharacterized protein YecE (DUF72 family)